ncbi:hypothetical protein ACSBR1_013226 [Camellia fascicularis]
MKFMDFLVNSSKDVEILSNHGIIHNLLGDNAVVSTMWSKLGNTVVIHFFGYHVVYNNVNKHYKESWNRWLEILRRNYFNTPWALFSFLAALLLLVLTVMMMMLKMMMIGDDDDDDVQNLKLFKKKKLIWMMAVMAVGEDDDDL